MLPNKCYLHEEVFDSMEDLNTWISDTEKTKRFAQFINIQYVPGKPGESFGGGGTPKVTGKYHLFLIVGDY